MGSDQQQHFCLRWNNFHSNIASSFETLRDHEEFVDVTLACEGHSLKAHKVVLSACSPYFKNLLRQNPCQHPIIILRDVAFHDLSALLSFVYQGEVYVSQERLPAFLRTAEMLHIKGLTEQHHNHALHRGSSFSLGPLPTSATVNSNHEHLQGMLSSRVNSVGSASSPPLSPSTRQNSSHPPSPLPKKRRSVSGTLGVSGSSPPGGISTSSIMAAPTSSTPPHREGLPNSDHENHVGIPLRLRDSPSLSTVLTQPISTAHSSHSDLVVTPLAVNSRPPPLKALTNATSSTHTSPDAAGGVNIKLEATDVKQENSQNSSPDEAVNLVTEGSILRQRIQGLRASPDSPYFPSSRAPSSHEESSMDERFSGQDLRSEYDRDSRFDFERDGRYEFERDGRGADYDRETTFTDHDKEMYHSGSPMLIRSPLAGLLPRDAPGLFGSAGTSASLTHQGDSSQDAEYLVRACVPKLWNSRQPGICPICNRVFSNKFNLKQHIINIHTKSEGIECDLCHKKCKNKWYLRRHQVTHHGAPLKRNRSFPVVDHHFVNDENDRCQREKQQHAAAAAAGE